MARTPLGGLSARAIMALTPVALFATVLVPWSGRLRYPSIVWDDVQRVIDLQTLSLPERLMRPFNEHLAPGFELVTAAAWECAGRRLEHAPMAFTLASYLPYVLSLVMLWALARREWRSPTVAGVAVALFASTPIYAECVLWFSASTFSWALLAALVALGLAGRAVDRGSAWCAAGSAAACLVAPMGSTIGLLAGPAATVRAWPGRRPSRPYRAEALALAPILGTLANVLIAGAFCDHNALAGGARTPCDVPGGLACAVRAPLHLVLAGYAGVAQSHRVVPYFAPATFLVAALALAIVGAARGPGNTRRWLAIGTLLIGCGYAMTYCARATLIGPDSLLKVPRYHLFPCLGLVLLLTGLAAPRLRRLDGRPVAGPAVVLGIAVALVAVNRPSMARKMEHYRRLAGQGPVLAMIDRVAEVARSRGLDRAGVVRALEPLEPRWALAGTNVLAMLPEIPGARPDGPDADRVRAAIRGGLSPRDGTLLFADMNATALLRPDACRPRTDEPEAGRLVGSLRIRPAAGRPGLFLADGWPSHLEFAFPPGRPAPRALALTGLTPGKTLEVWWAGEGGWSPDRRVVVRLDPFAPARPGWVLPLDRLPNLETGGGISRVRLTVREPGPVAIGPPSLLR